MDGDNAMKKSHIIAIIVIAVLLLSTVIILKYDKNESSTNTEKNSEVQPTLESGQSSLESDEEVFGEIDKELSSLE